AITAVYAGDGNFGGSTSATVTQHVRSNIFVTGAGPGGGPTVVVSDALTRAPLFNFFPYDMAFTGGVRVAAGDVNGDGKADIISGSGVGGGPNVTVFNGATADILASFFAYQPAFTNGLYVAAGDVNGDGRAEIIVGAGEKPAGPVN